jgi:hypothetical protein
MAAKIGKRIYRTATPEEKASHKQIRDQILEELPEIKQRARQRLAEAMQQGVEIQHTIALLKAERIKKGLSLSELNEHTGIEAATLLRLENNEDANPTISVLARYADAVGKKVLVVLANADD